MIQTTPIKEFTFCKHSQKKPSEDLQPQNKKECVHRDGDICLISNDACKKCENIESTIRVVKEGGLWFFETNSFRSKPLAFDEFIKIDPGEVAKQLKTTGKAVFTAWIGVTSYFNGDLATTIQRGQSNIERELKGLDLFNRLVKIRRSTVKEDDYMVKMALLHMATAYITEPANLCVEAPSSEGKTHPIVETARLFPQNNIWYLAGLSSTAIAHEHGVLADAETREPLEPEILKLQAELRETKDKSKRGELMEELVKLTNKSAYLVDLENKILIFLDRPHPETLQKLYPILSHDVYEADYKFTDRKAKGPLKTVHVILRGWPVAIFIRTRGESTEDEWIQTVSRFTTVSPSMGGKKYRAAIEFKAMLRGTPIQILNPMLGLDEELWAREALEAVKDRLIEIKRKVRAHGNPKGSMFWIPFHKLIGEVFPAEAGRRIRDADRFLALLQAHAAINVFSRPRLVFADGTEYIIVTREDFEDVYSLFFSEEDKLTILTGLSRNIIEFFRKVVIPIWRNNQGAFTVSDLVDATPKSLGRTLADVTIRTHYLKPLKNAGFITSEPDPNDRRREVYRVLIEDFKTFNSNILRSDLNFKLESLREAWNELRKIRSPTPDFIICDFNGEKLSIEQLYELYFKPREPSGGEKPYNIESDVDERINQSQNQASFEEETEKSRSEHKITRLSVYLGEEDKKDEDQTGGYAIVGDALDGYVCVKCGKPAIKVIKIKGVQEAVCNECLKKISPRHLETPLEERIKKAEEVYKNLKSDGLAMVEEPIFLNALKQLDPQPEALLEHLIEHGKIFRPKDGWMRWIGG